MARRKLRPSVTQAIRAAKLEERRIRREGMRSVVISYPAVGEVVVYATSGGNRWIESVCCGWSDEEPNDAP